MQNPFKIDQKMVLVHSGLWISVKPEWTPEQAVREFLIRRGEDLHKTKYGSVGIGQQMANSMK